MTDGRSLYTLYRQWGTLDHEFTVALDPATGRTLWQSRGRAGIRKEDRDGWGGQAPNATPLLAGGKLFVMGSLAELRAALARLAIIQS